ncbi:helix-turn-helix domain-containing protein [Hungatella sp.]|uniref:helix-turn-helix domain-containing protein n=1 Tax=Hungatella sp. TaxID=2613924 RepID=UPI003AB3F607
MDTTNTDLLCSRLKELRSSLSLTQKEFAEKIGASSVSVSSYEIGAKTPSLEMLITISTTFKISLDWLCGLSNELDNARPIATYSDLIKMLLSILDNQIIDSNIVLLDKPEEYDYPPENDTFPYLYINDIQIKSFFIEWFDMENLRQKGTIKESLYQLWLKDKLESLSNPLTPFNRIAEHGLPFN